MRGGISINARAHPISIHDPKPWPSCHGCSSLRIQNTADETDAKPLASELLAPA
jgi:hypothetical protein